MFPKFDIGKSGENYVAYFINKLGFECVLNNDYEKRYDYDLITKVDKLKFTIEVKYDLYSAKSGNIAIEIRNSKKDCPSGIYCTLADIWIHLTPDKDSDEILAYAISTQNLKAFIESVPPLKSTKHSGDNNANLLLYKKEDILPAFSRVDNVNSVQFKKIIRNLLQNP